MIIGSSQAIDLLQLIGRRKVTDEEVRIMNKYGITYETRTVYYWKNYKYEKLSDAVRNAKMQRETNGKS